MLQCLSSVARWVMFGAIGFGALSSAHAGRVTEPNGEYLAEHIDLSVKVLGGEVQAKRTWAAGRWYLNPEWAPLRFELDNLDKSVRYIERLGNKYEKAGTDLYSLNYNRFIKRSASGWTWYNSLGERIEYDASGRAVRSTDRNGVNVSIDLDGAGRRLVVRAFRQRSANVCLRRQRRNLDY
jgi:YD repeat-containing protein